MFNRRGGIFAANGREVLYDMTVNNEYAYRYGVVTTGKATGFPGYLPGEKKLLPEDSEFARLLNDLMTEIKADETNVQFSKHAVERLYERNIDLYGNDTLERLNRAVGLASEKGSNDALVMIDQTAFVVSVANNKVITTLSADDLIEGSIFTNIDSTVFM
jgi:flagellar operon protein